MRRPPPRTESVPVSKPPDTQPETVPHYHHSYTLALAVTVYTSPVVPTVATARARRSKRTLTFYVELQSDGSTEIAVLLTGTGRVFRDNISFQPDEDTQTLLEGEVLPKLQEHLDKFGKTRTLEAAGESAIGWIEKIRDALPRELTFEGDMLSKPVVATGFAAYRGEEVAQIKISDETAFSNGKGDAIDMNEAVSQSTPCHSNIGSNCTNYLQET